MKPFKLAIATGNTKLQEMSLSCLHKMLAYGILEREGGEEAINLIASLGESENAGVQLGVLRAILTALTAQHAAAPSGTAAGEPPVSDGNEGSDDTAALLFHGEPVMVGIRTCYNIAVGSEEAGNRATARSALLQLMATVAKRADPKAVTVVVEKAATATGVGKNGEGGDVDPSVKTMVSSVITNIVSASMEGGGSRPQNGNGPAAAGDDDGAASSSPNTPDTSALAQMATQADVSAIEKALVSEQDEGGGGEKSSHEKGEHADEGGDGPKTTAGLHHSVRDVISVFRALAKLGARDVGPSETAIKGKVLAINLLVVLIQSMPVELGEVPIIQKLLKRHACVTVLRNALSTIPALQESVASLLSVVALRFRMHLKTELGALIPLMFIRPLELEKDVSVVQKMSALLELQKLLRNASFVADMFLNYDCDMGGANLYERMLTALSALVAGNGSKSGAMRSSTLAREGGAGVSPGTLASKSLQCLLSVIEAMHEWATKSAPGGQIIKVMSSEAIEEGRGQNGDGPSDRDAESIGHMKAAKTTLETGVIAFNSNPSKGIRLMTAAGIIDGTTESIARFLMETNGLDKATIGDFLGHHDPEKIEILKEYTNMKDFSGQHLDEALRSFCSGFRLPGEAQKIDRIVERFSERFCENNPGVFKSTDAAYVLSFAIVMLNTDAHNPQVADKMSKEAFVAMSKETDAETVPQEVLEGIYDRIVSNEIKLKDDSDGGPTHSTEDKSAQKRARNGASALFAWARSEAPEQADTASSNLSALRNAREMIVHAQEGKSASSGDFREARQPQIVKPMMEVTGGLLLRTLQNALQISTNVTNVVDTIHGLHTMMRIAHLFETDGPLEAAFNTILTAAGSEEAFLPQSDVSSEHAIADIMIRVTPKQCIASKMILEIAESELALIGNASWSQVLRLLSAHSQLLALLEQVQEVPVIKPTTKAMRNEDLSSFNSSHGPPKYFQWLKSGGKSLLNSIFLSTKELNDESIAYCIGGIIEVSRSDMGADPDRTWLLSRLVEVTETNTWRLRIVWNRIWHRVGEYLIEIMGTGSTSVSMFALKALVHVSTRALIRDKDFAHANFQADTLRYLVPAMRMPSDELRAALMEMLATLIEQHGSILYSGWRLVFSALAVIARDKNKASRAAALNMAVNASKRMFEDISADCLPDVTNCLSTFANGDSSECMLAIQALKSCGVSMASRGSRNGEGETSGGEKGGLEGHFVVYGVYWIGLFVTFSEHSMDRRGDVRSESLSALLELIRDYSGYFNDDLWKAVFSSAILPLLDPVRSTMEGSDEAWLIEALKERRPLLAELLADLYPQSSAFLPQLFEVLCKSATSTVLPGMSLMSIDTLLEVVGALLPKLDAQDHGMAVQVLQSAMAETFPTTLLNSVQGEEMARGWIVRAVIAACEAQRRVQGELIAFAEDALKEGQPQLFWAIYDVIEDQARQLATLNSSGDDAAKLDTLHCRGLKESVAKDILASLSHSEDCGWTACVRLLDLSRKRGTQDDLAGGDASICDLKHISLVDSALGDAGGAPVSLSSTARSIVESLDQIGEAGFSRAMHTLFPKLANLSMSENAATREVFHAFLVGRFWTEVKSVFEDSAGQ